MKIAIDYKKEEHWSNGPPIGKKILLSFSSALGEAELGYVQMIPIHLSEASKSILT